MNPAEFSKIGADANVVLNDILTVKSGSADQNF